MSTDPKTPPDNQRNEKLEETIGANRAAQDANADSGGTTDMDSTIRKSAAGGTGSGLSSKTAVTGSDFDGQVSDQ